MFPVPSNQRLSFSKIADYWSRGMNPPTNRDELFDFLVKAWWRGEFVASGAKRVDVLKAIHKVPPSWITFERDQQIRELPDGIVEVRLFVPIPKANPESWTDEDCMEAFHVMAEIWDSSDFQLFIPIVWGLELTEAEFTRWVGSYDYSRGAFWARGESAEGTPVANKISRSKLAELAREYYESIPEEPQRSQSGFEHWLEAKGIRGPRGYVRGAYKQVAGPLRAGRPKGATQRHEAENPPELNSPQICK
jgi:hypothetical protein